MSSSAISQRRRCVVLGLDGLPLERARAWCAQGRTPQLARLLEHKHPAAGPHPVTGSVHAELPDLSPVNWTSLFTAQGPEVHGVYGFSRIHPHSYETGLTNFDAVACPTIFQRLNAEHTENGITGVDGALPKIRFRVINLPNTYPARQLNGMLISGFVAHDLNNAVYPPFLAAPLRAAGYQLEADTSRARTEPGLLLDALHTSLRSRRAALDMLWPDLAWDCFIFVLTETDRLFHFLWDACEDAGHPLHAACMEFIAAWDTLIGHFLDRVSACAADSPVRLIAVADHGFTALRTECDLNAWLRAEGYLTQNKAPKLCTELESTSLSPQSTAFALDPGRIYLHTAARFSRGCLSAHQAEMLEHTLRAKLRQLSWNGQAVFADIHSAAELYGPLSPSSPPSRHAAPDLVCVPAPGMDLKAKWNRETIFGTFGRTGTHSPDGALFFDSHGARPQRLRDVGQEIFNWFSISNN